MNPIQKPFQPSDDNPPFAALLPRLETLIDEPRAQSRDRPSPTVGVVSAREAMIQV
jgi:hypothetical protein